MDAKTKRVPTDLDCSSCDSDEWTGFICAGGIAWLCCQGCGAAWHWSYGRRYLNEDPERDRECYEALARFTLPAGFTVVDGALYHNGYGVRFFGATPEVSVQSQQAGRI